MLPLPALGGGAGSAPGTSRSGSDQNASLEAERDARHRRGDSAPHRRAVCRRLAGTLTSVLTDSAVPGAITRSCVTACGSAWPVKTAIAAAAVAATSVVSAAAAATTQCAVIRRIVSGPRGLSTGTAFRTKTAMSKVRRNVNDVNG